MLEITTAKQPQQQVKVDGFVYTVRKPGAGESYFLSQAQRNVQKLKAKIDAETATDDDKQQYEKLATKALKVATTLFDAQGNDEAQDHFDRLEAEVLFKVIEQVFNELDESEPEPQPVKEVADETVEKVATAEQPATSEELPTA